MNFILEEGGRVEKWYVVSRVGDRGPGQSAVDRQPPGPLPPVITD